MGGEREFDLFSPSFMTAVVTAVSALDSRIKDPNGLIEDVIFYHNIMSKYF